MLQGLLNGAAEDSLIDRAIRACEAGEFALMNGKSSCPKAREYRKFAFDVVHTKGLRSKLLVEKWNRFEPKYQEMCETKTTKSWQRRHMVPVTTDKE